MQQGRKPPAVALIDVTAIPALRRLELEPGMVEVGAAVSHTEIVNTSLPGAARHLPGGKLRRHRRAAGAQRRHPRRFPRLPGVRLPRRNQIPEGHHVLEHTVVNLRSVASLFANVL
jgi:hypothetical protein